MELKEVSNNQGTFLVNKVEVAGFTTEFSFADLLKTPEKSADLSSQIKDRKKSSALRDGENAIASRVENSNKNTTKEVSTKSLDTRKNSDNVKNESVKDKKLESKEVKSRDFKEDDIADDTGDLDLESENLIAAFVYGEQRRDDLPVTDQLTLSSSQNGEGIKSDMLLFPSGDTFDGDVSVSLDATVAEDFVEQISSVLSDSSADVADLELASNLQVGLEDLSKDAIEEVVKFVPETPKVNGTYVKETNLLKAREANFAQLDIDEVEVPNVKLELAKKDLGLGSDEIIDMSDVAEVKVENLAVDAKKSNPLAQQDVVATASVNEASDSVVKNVISYAVDVNSSMPENDLPIPTISVAEIDRAGLVKSESIVVEDKSNVKDIHKGLSKEAIEQIKVNITKSAVKGINRINIQLKPENLGNIEVKLNIGRDGKVDAQIVSSRLETLESLQKEIQSLEKAFNNAGFNANEDSFSFRHENGQKDKEQLNSFIGEVLEKDSELVSQEYFWNTNTGVNIRV